MECTGYDWLFSGTMRVNIMDAADALTVLVTLPGVKKEDIRLALKDEFLNVKVEKSKEEEEKNYLWREFANTGLERDILVGQPLRQEDVSAAYDNGLLTVTIQKEKPQTVPVS